MPGRSRGTPSSGSNAVGGFGCQAGSRGKGFKGSKDFRSYPNERNAWGADRYISYQKKLGRGEEALDYYEFIWGIKAILLGRGGSIIVKNL